MPKWKADKWTLAIPAILVMLIMLLPLTALAGTPSDLDGHWAKGQITDWIDQGLINGYPDGTFKPDSKITRAEFMVLVNGAFGFTETADLNYTDVKTGDWYTRAVAQASAAGYISGYADGSVKPNDPISRQEAAVVVMKVKKLALSEASADKFSDAGQIPTWSKGAVGSAAAAGIMGGYPDGTFKASNLITRAEAVAALSKAVNGSAPSTPADESQVYDVAGTYGPQSGTETIDGNATIKVSGITLQNMVINGDLIIDKSVAQGNATLKKVVVKGNTYIYGGGVNSIYFIDSQTGKTYVAKDDGPVRIVVSGTTDIDQLIAQNSCNIQEVNLSGEGVDDIVVSKTHDGEVIINIVYASVENIEVNSDGVTIITGRDTTIGKLTANRSLKVTGNGTIEKAVINASGVTLAVKPQILDVAEGVTPPIITVTTSGGGGGGGGTPSVSVNAISDVNLIEGAATTTQSVTTTPADAVVAAVSSSTDVAAVSVSGHDISITAGVPGTSTITVTASKTGYTNGTRTFLVNVAARAVSAVTVKTDPALLSYVEGQSLDLTGLEATLTYNDASSEDVVLADFAAKGIATDPADGAALSLADNGQAVVLTCNGHTADTSILTVAAKEVTSIVVKTQPSDLSYVEGQSLDLTGLEVTLTYNDTSTEDVGLASFAAKGVTANPADGAVLSLAYNGQAVGVTCNGHTTSTNNLVVVARAVASIVVKTQPSDLSYVEGQSLDLTGLEVTLTYNDTSTEDVGLATFAVKGITTAPVQGGALSLAHNGNPVVLTCNGQIANTNNLVVVAREVTSIAITTQPSDLSYVEGQSLDLTGLVVTLTYNDTTTEDVGPASFAAKGVTAAPAHGAVLALANNGNPVVLTCNGHNASTNNLVVVAKEVTSIVVKTQPSDLNYVEGQSLDLTGLAATLTYNDASSEDVDAADFASKGITADPAAGTALTIADHNGITIALTCNGQNASTNNLLVVAREPASVSVKTQPDAVSYYDGQSLNLTGLVVTVTYNDETSEDVALADFAAYGITVSPVNGTVLTTTDTAVTITINGKTTSQAITVTQRVLTADTTLNSVDNDIIITFAADAAFEAAITGVSFNGTALTVTTDYAVSSGTVTLKPSGGNLALRTPATANVVITATGYADATVEQIITAGAANSITVTTHAVPGANGQDFATQPVITIKDKYDNVCVNGPAAARSVYAISLNGVPGSWSLYGTLRQYAVGGVATYTDLQCWASTPGTGSIMFQLEDTPYYEYSIFTLPNIEITSFKAIANIDAGAAGYAAYASAAEVQAVLPTNALANPNNLSVPVTSWTDTDGYDPSTPGSYTFTAVLGAIPTGYINTGGYTAAVEVVLTSPVKTVTVGALTGGDITAQSEATGRTYPVTTEYIADGQTASITWYGDTNKTSNNNTPPPGIAITPAGSVTSNALTLNVSVTHTFTVAGSYYFTVTIDGVESEVKTLTVGNAVTVIEAQFDESYATYSLECLVITGLSGIAADSVFDPTQLVIKEGSGSSYQLTGPYSAVADISSMTAGTYYFNGIDTLAIGLNDPDYYGLIALPGFVLGYDTLTALEGWNISNEIAAGQVDGIPITYTT